MPARLTMTEIKQYFLRTVIAIIGLCVIGGIVYAVSQVKFEEPKTICVKSHTDSQMEYSYGYGAMSGKIGYGWHLVTTDICDKEAPNPKYTGKP